MVEALQRWRSSVPYDAVKAWDARARKWYGDRYDFRRNMVSGEAVPVGLSAGGGACQGGRGRKVLGAGGVAQRGRHLVQLQPRAHTHACSECSLGSMSRPIR